MSGADFVPVDAAIRRRAVETLDRPLLVEAGAGTGKTTLLVDRLVYALETDAVRMPRVVAITFTEKAAAELRLRLRVGIEHRRAAAGLDAEGRQRLGRALHEMDRATLSTIHAFAGGLLREQPLQAGVDPRFRTLDELESLQFFRAYWQRWVDAELADPGASAALRPALLAGVRLEPDLFDLAREMELQRDVQEELRVPPPAADLPAQLRALRDGILACAHHAEEHCRVQEDEGLRALRALGAQLAPLADTDPEGWAAFFLGRPRLRTTAGRRENWDPGTAAENKAQRVRLADEQERVQRSIAATVLHGVLGWLQRFGSDYAAEKRRRGVLDFQDLLLEARRLVRDDPRVRRELATRIDMLCVDEFQDTDPLQAELVLFLCETGGPAVRWLDVQVGARLFLVGDPKQSIYRFRRADLDVYQRCAERVVDSGGERLDIVQNFRSRPAILGWANGVFERLFAADLEGSPRHVPLVPAPGDGTVPAVWVLRGRSTEPPTAGDAWRHDEAQAVVAWLQQAFAAGFPVRDHDELRPLRPGDVALLFARTSGIETYEAALRAAGVPFQQEGGRLFFQRQEVRDVLHALAAVEDPHDELSIVGALRSPLFGATDEELWLHRAGAKTFSYLEPAPGSPLAGRLAVLFELHAERHRRGIGGTILALLDRTAARAVLAGRPQGAQALANLETLERLARRFEAGSPAGLREFVRSLGDVDEDAPRLAEWTPQDEGAERVRLLTVHMAKGLEFPCVVLVNLSTAANRRGGAIVVDRLAGRVEVRLRGRELGTSIGTPGYEEIAAGERTRELAEERRLLYVAATRARDYLVVSTAHGRRPDGLLRGLALVPGAIGMEAEEGAWEALPPPTRGLDWGPETAWCVIEGESLAVAPAPARGARPGIDLESLWQRREAWRVEQQDRLVRGGWRPTATPPPLGPADGPEGAPSWARVRSLIARVLRWPTTGAPSDLPARLREVAETLGDLEHVPEAERALEALETSGVLAGILRSRRRECGVRIVAERGAIWIDAWLDLLWADESGAWTLVELAPGGEPAQGEGTPRSTAADPALLETVRWKAVAAEAAGCALREVGIVCLVTGEWRPVEGRLEDWDGDEPVRT